jgi:hypothetical protein
MLEFELSTVKFENEKNKQDGNKKQADNKWNKIVYNENNRYNHISVGV